MSEESMYSKYKSGEITQRQYRDYVAQQDGYTDYADYMKQYAEKNKDKLFESHKRYRKEHKEEIAEKKRKHYQENIEQEKEKKRQWYHNNPEKVKASRKKNKERRAETGKLWRENNKDKANELQKQWRKDNPDYQKQYYKNNKDRCYLNRRDEKLEYQKQYYQENKDEVLDYHRSFYQENRDIIREQRKHNNKDEQLEKVRTWNYRHTKKGRIAVKKRKTKRYRGLGDIILNKSEFGKVGFVGHHITEEHVLYIPEELHKSVPGHSALRDKKMDEINELAIDWYVKYLGLS